jgi:hypothetical protein
MRTEFHKSEEREIALKTAGQLHRSPASRRISATFTMLRRLRYVLM